MSAETVEQIERDKAELRAAWDELIAELQLAREAIDNPKYFPPEASNRNLAEGYRYLAGFVHHGIERTFFGDPDFPAFRNGLSVFNKGTIENSDAIYFYAPIDGRQRYLVKGKAEDFSHWQGERHPGDGPKAPHYLYFESSSGPMSGDTGDLSELRPGFRTGFGTLDSSQLQVSDSGEIELLLAPDRPEGYSGNFICTRKPPGKRDSHGEDRYATFISGRQLFYDWETEVAIPLTITPLDRVGLHPEPLDAAQAAQNLRNMGGIIRGQMHFWLDFYDKILNIKGSHGTPEDGQFFFPINGYLKPNAAGAATGGGMSTNVYAGGLYELKEDEALYIEARFTGNPVYSSVHLGNLWGESPDYANHQSSLNLFQMHMGPDGVQRWVVAHRDPGVQNWLDTTGLSVGCLSHRWAYSELPEEKDWPKITATKIPFDKVREYFPEDMPVLTEEERREAIYIRQQHVQRRYRVF